MSDIVQRLRDFCIDWDGSSMSDQTEPMPGPHWAELREAADTIEHMRDVMRQVVLALHEAGHTPKHGQHIADAIRAALAQPAAPVVERLNAATPVVERSAGNVSDNAAPVEPAVPVAWHCPNDPDSATAFYWRRTSNGMCPNCGKKLLPVVAEQDIAVPPHGPRRAVMLAEVPPARVPLYDQAALDAALNLWPRDCRLCAHFTTQTGGCTSAVQCVDSAQFKTTPPRQYWAAGPNV